MPDYSREPLVFPKRTVHLDFHTGPRIPDVGANFDPEQFARTFKDAHVDSVTVFAKCHHGHLYYKTDRAERHPGLSTDLNLLEQQVEALHKVGIRAPIYLSVQCDEYAANTHPEWITLTEELKQVKWGGSPYVAGWQIMDMSSPYQDFLAEQLQEVLDRFAPVDGIFMDMCWDQTSSSPWAIEGAVKAGLDPRKTEDRAKYARQVVLGYMGRYRDMVESAHKGHSPAGIWFNSRPKTELHVEKEFVRHIEVECLPTGGWGYAYFPYVARYVRSVAPLPTLTHTGRFFKSWGDNASLKPEMALKYECCQALSMGMTRGVGDLLHPRGVPSKAVYDLIGSVYAHIEACEPYVEDAQHVSDILVLVDPELGENPGPSAMGTLRALMHLRHQFDLAPPTHDLTPYALVIVPENIAIDGALRDRLQTYVKQGGSLIVSGNAALDGDGQPAMPELGIIAEGPSPYTHTFLHAAPAVSEGLADYGYVMYEQGFRMRPADGAEALAQVGEPYFERAYNHFSGHEYTPEDEISGYAAAVKNGRVITFSVPILEAYGKHAAPNYRTLIGNCIQLLLPQPVLRAGGPSFMETSVLRRGDSTLVHLLSFNAERRADGLDIVEDPIPLVDVPVAVQTTGEPTRVVHAPSGAELPFTYDGVYARVNVTELGGHCVLAFE